MTKEEFQNIFRDLQGTLAALIKSAAPLARVYDREIFNENESIWLAALKSPEDNNRVHGFSVAFAGIPTINEETAIATAAFEPVFRIVGYLAHEFGTDADNSSDRFINELNAIRYALHNDRTLGVDYVSDHDGFREQIALTRIDSQLVHIARANIRFRLHPVPYEYR